jgi:CheY-like chemotaxis protein
MDCQMPEMDGYQATIEVRRREGLERHTPIVAMTANALHGDREKCIAVGMDAYIAKPVRQDQLAIVLNKFLLPSDGKDEPVVEDAKEPCLDISVLHGFDNSDMDDEPDLITELIELYLVDASEQFETMHKAFDEEDPESFRRAAHSLKGSSANLGVRRLAELTQEMERFGTKDSFERIKELLPLCELEFDRVQKVLAEEKSRRL